MKITGLGNDGILLSQGVTFSINGVTLTGIASADIMMRPGQLVEANLLIHIERIELMGVGPKYMCRHPESEEIAEVEEIIFKSGDVWCAS